MTAKQAHSCAAGIETAADWFARRRSGRMTADELAGLQAWLDADPDHAAAYRDVARGWEAAGAVRAEPEILQVREQARRARPQAWSVAAAAAAAAALMVAVIGGWATLDLPAPDFLTPGQQTIRTHVGQTSTVSLRDGSLVTLDTDTVLRVRLTPERRLLRLEKGQAYFKVAKDPSRPFIVAAGDKLVTATGTAFSVRLEDKAVEVVLVEGHVRVEAAPQPARAGPAPPSTVTEMKAGSALVAPEDETWELASIDASKATSWTSGQLIFEDRPLAEAVDELNRYSTKKIVIRDPAIGRAMIVSVVRAGDVDGFLRFVTLSGFARVVSETERTVELAAPEEKVGDPAA